MAKAKSASRKPSLATRKPPAAPPVDARAVEEFVGNGPAVGTPGHRVAVRTDGREMRRLTVYLPTELYRRLATYSTLQEQDRSAVITAAVATFLDEQGRGR